MIKIKIETPFLCIYILASIKPFTPLKKKITRHKSLKKDSSVVRVWGTRETAQQQAHIHKGTTNSWVPQRYDPGGSQAPQFLAQQATSSSTYSELQSNHRAVVSKPSEHCLIILPPPKNDVYVLLDYNSDFKRINNSEVV